MQTHDYLIGGIQQVGIGVDRLAEAMRWYAESFGMDVMVFREKAAASLMTHYTGGEVHHRHAAMLLNLAGGGGVEAWQYTSRTPMRPLRSILVGDLGFMAATIKVPALLPAFDTFYASDFMIYDDPCADPEGREHFFVADTWGNLFSIYESSEFFTKPAGKTAGIAGVMIGVSDMQASLPLYRDVLGYDLVYDVTDVFKDFHSLQGGLEKYRRVLLRKSGSGPFGKLLGTSTIELVQVLNRKAHRIFQGRLWGDLGFIHTCFDVVGMDALKARCESAGFPFRIDSGDAFFMEAAAGRFAYIEGPDGVLIEFVETLRLPVTSSWTLSLKRSWKQRHIPSVLLRAMSAKRLKKKMGVLQLPPDDFS